MLRQSERRLCIQRCMCHLVKEIRVASLFERYPGRQSIRT